ncbi:MAG: 5'/3'-nucleotidase SurE [Steroidobacteraceae bacterium]
MNACAPRAVPLAAAVLGALLAAHDARAADPLPICGSGPLDILLTNDDGWQAPGLRALYAALRAAGHRVTVAAPDHNASGTGSSLTWGPVTVVQDPADPAIHGVAGTPATAAVFGITALYPAGRRPDLVISGINDGENTGSQLAVSGTVGAALAGTMLVSPPVPGIAVNAERPAAGDTHAGTADQRFAAIARHLAGLLGTMRGWFCSADGQLRGTAALNVNYPARPVAEVAGVAAARQAEVADMALSFVPDGDHHYRSERTDVPVDPAAGTDLALLGRGYVTVTPIGPGLAPGGPFDDLSRRLDRR